MRRPLFFIDYPMRNTLKACACNRSCLFTPRSAIAPDRPEQAPSPALFWLRTSMPSGLPSSMPVRLLRRCSFGSRWSISALQLPALWVIMCIQYAGQDRWLTRPMLVALFLIPAVTLVLRYTDSYWRLFYSGLLVQPFPHIGFTRGLVLGQHVLPLPVAHLR